MAVKFSHVSPSQGMALVEILPLLVLFVTFFSLLLGFWGAIHSSLLQSIAARHYALEVINNRSHVEYHRDFRGSTAVQASLEARQANYHGEGRGSQARTQVYDFRFFAIVQSQGTDQPQLLAETRGLGFFNDIDRESSAPPGGNLSTAESSGRDFQDKKDFLFSESEQEDELEPANPLWLMQGYGICLKASCGEEE